MWVVTKDTMAMMGHICGEENQYLFMRRGIQGKPASDVFYAQVLCWTFNATHTDNFNRHLWDSMKFEEMM